MPDATSSPRPPLHAHAEAQPLNTEHVLTALCNSVTKVLNLATHSQVQYSGMVQRIHKTCLRPDIGCFVLFDGGFSGLVILNFTADAAMELYRNYMLNMGLPAEELAHAYTADEVSNVMGELMNQVLGDFISKVRRELQTHITQSQPKMLALNKQVQLSVDANLDKPEARRVTFYTASNHIFYLELAMDSTEFIKLYDFEPQEEVRPDEVMAQVHAGAASPGAEGAAAAPASSSETDELLRSLGM